MGTKDYKLLVINPGSTSTKVAVFENTKALFTKSIKHSHDEVMKYETIASQMDFRKDVIVKEITDEGYSIKDFDCIVGRGGFVSPCASGTYQVNEKMIDDLNNSLKTWGREHASNLGGLISYEIAQQIDKPAFIVDPVVVDELDDVARISGSNLIERTSLFHALNLRSVIRQTYTKLKKKPEECNFIGVHLGGGVSVVAYREGRFVDVNNALLGMGPFSPQRSGALPIGDLIELCYSGKYTQKQLTTLLSRTGGVVSYLGTDDMIKVEEMYEQGDEKAMTVIQAMSYQIAKEIGACFSVLCGKCDGLVLTGGLSRSDIIVDLILERVPFLQQVFKYPGEFEMEALAEGAYLALTGDEPAKAYKGILKLEAKKKMKEISISKEWAMINEIKNFKALENVARYIGSIGEKSTIVCAVPEEEPAIQAIYKVYQLGCIKPILVGNRERIMEIIDETDIDEKVFEFVEVADPIKACERASMMVRDGEADIMMKGLVSTSVVLHAAMNKETGFRKKDGLMSHVAVAEVDGFDKLMIISDAGLNIDPSLMEKKCIIENAVKVAHTLGNMEPKVSLLSASETVNVKMDASIDNAILSKMNERKQIKGAIVDGPLALDLAVSKKAVEHKGVVSPVAGNSDILIVDNIDVGNVLIKSLIYFAKANWAGIVLGAKNPIVVSSRSDSDLTKYYSILLSIVYDYQNKS